MRRKGRGNLTIFIFGVIFGIALSFTIVFILLHNRMFIVYESRFSFGDTVQVIEESAAENNWSIPHRYDLQATMKKNGFNVKPVMVISLCKPEHAYKILSAENSRKISAILPCRVAVYEKDGKIYVSMLNAGLFSRFLGNNVSEVMNTALEENQIILQPIIKK